MSDRKLAKAVQVLFRQIWKLYRALSKALVTWLLRSALVMNRRRPRRRQAVGGFVLPTTVLLILVVGLTAGALSYRAFTSSNRVIGETQNRVIYNAATPAVDRARSKLEFLFDSNRDNRLPSGVPSEEFLMAMLLNTDPPAVIKGRTGPTALRKGGEDPYNLPDETRVDINGDGVVDNAWSYRSDSDGDGAADATVIYSIIFSTPVDQGNKSGWQRLLELKDAQKAQGESDGGRTISYVRTGPLSNSSGINCGGGSSSSGGAQAGGTNVEKGWYEDQVITSILRKSFQVDAFVVPDKVGKGGASNFTTLEFQQDRILNRGNKWGAWFRNDLELYPGATFNWNGAMHTEGSLVIGSSNFNAYLISSPSSCLFYPSASEITVTKTKDPDTQSDFRGLIMSGSIRDNNTDGSTLVYLHSNNPIGSKVTMTSSNDWVKSGTSPGNISLSPEALQTRNGYVAKDGTGNTTAIEENNNFAGRFKAQAEAAPYVDDTYRADNRYGPKQKYNDQAEGQIRSPKKAGDPIDPSVKLLVGDEPAAGEDSSIVGLDGYWERRARNEGLRVLVGQRLELGNSNGWQAPKDRPNSRQDLTSTTVAAGDGDYNDLRKLNYTNAPPTAPFQADANFSDDEGDPLYPPYSVLTHEAKQRRALRDNLAAVQSTAVYHAAVDKDFPIACYASTAHPGTPLTLRQSINFIPTFFIDSSDASVGGSGLTGTKSTVLMSNFFLGQGTNGWEYTPPQGDEATFSGSLAVGQPLRNALDNLAQFAGDPEGAFPPVQESGAVHPDPELTMWGNFSNLRRALASYDAVGYERLSPADKTYLHTAACTIGMLAYNIDAVQRYDPRNVNNDSTGTVRELASKLFLLMDGKVDNGEVLPKERLATYGYDRSKADTAYVTQDYNPRDYDQVPAEAFLAKLREQYIIDNGPSGANQPVVRMAELIFTHFQVRRDRTYGFRSSPAANTWNYNPYVADYANKTNLWSSACDPNIFAFNGANATTAGPLSARANLETPTSGTFLRRLALSRLCGTVTPAGAIREFPGDLNYPARNNTSDANNLRYIPKPNTTPVDAFPQEADPVTGELLTSGGNNDQRTFRETQKAFRDLNTGNGYEEIYRRATVAPKWPSLYYLFPEVEHDQDGRAQTIGTSCVDHRQPNGALAHVNAGCAEAGAIPAAFQPWAEPYVAKAVAINGATATYKVVSSTIFRGLDAEYGPDGYDTGAPIDITDALSSNQLKFTYKTFGYSVPDLSVAEVAVRPRRLPNTFPIIAALNTEAWKLPVLTEPTNPPIQNTPPNRIRVYDNNNPVSGRTAVVPFLDRVMFDGRERLPVRVLDFDIGMLRRTRPSADDQKSENVTFDGYNRNDVWLPVSGIIYAFREDAVREDAIARPPAAGSAAPAGGTNKTTATSPDPAVQRDPSQTELGISRKPIDYVADPDRRPYGFRLRNATQLKRHQDMGLEIKDNFRGLSFFTDNPVYIMGFYNLHQNLGDDQGDPSPSAETATCTPGSYCRLEEFTQKLPVNSNYNEGQFYTNRTTRDSEFAKPDKDRWRPSEILADSISVISNNFCDGSAIDTFMTTALRANDATISTATYSGDDNRLKRSSTIVDNLHPYRLGGSGAAVYNDTNSALYGSGCSSGGQTSFLNQNRPNRALPVHASANYDWARENPYDIFSPVRVSRNGHGLITPPRSNDAASNSIFLASQPESATGFNGKPEITIDYPTVQSGGYYTIPDGRAVQVAQPTRVNSIIISGIVPSRTNQSYGGMHNFPRLLERWNGTPLWFAGSFLQLNFANYDTAPYDQDAWEPDDNPAGGESYQYYEPPNRLWGYDVALQQAPAGPAAARFVTATKERNEFYTQPSANDPYIKNLCKALPDSVIPDNKCPA